MSVGSRAFLNIERPDASLIEAFREIPSANIGDCMQRMYCMFGGIKPFNGIKLTGPAFTVKVPAGDNLMAQAALDYAKPGDIVVIDGAGYTDRALFGGMMLAYAQMRGIGGFIVNGAVRDTDDILAGSIPVYGLSATPLGPYREGPGEINVPVVCGGQVVMPGDILVGDGDGVVIIPKNDAEEVLEAARKNLAMEAEEMARMKSGEYSEEAHRNKFTGAFLKRGGVFLDDETKDPILTAM